MTTLETTTLSNEGGTLEQNRFGRLSHRGKQWREPALQGQGESGGFVGTESEPGAYRDSQSGGWQSANRGIQHGFPTYPRVRAMSG